jgi:hypothetical protein
MMLTSCECVALALDHKEAERVPLELGGTPATSMHVSSVYRLRQALRLDPPGTPVKVVEPFQMLGEIKPDLLDAVGADVVPLGSRKTFFGFMNEGWQPWTFWEDTPLLVPEGFNTEPEPNGDVRDGQGLCAVSASVTSPWRPPAIRPLSRFFLLFGTVTSTSRGML